MHLQSQKEVLLCLQRFLVVGYPKDVTCKFLSIPPDFTESSLVRDVGRTINQASYTSNTAMTDEACITYCSNLGYIYAGTEYSSQCCEFKSLVDPLQLS
jgi:hypothetical protein